MKYPINKILVIRFSSIGDILLTTPSLRALKRSCPGAEVHIMLKSEYADLVRENPNVDEIIQIDPSKGTVDFLRQVRGLRGRYDLLIDFHRSLRSLVLRSLSGIPSKLKYSKGAISRFIMIHTGWKAIAMKEPIPERYLKALEPINAEDDGKGIDFFIPESVRERISKIMTEEANALDISVPIAYLALAPGAKWATKRWLPERFAQAADSIAESFNMVPVLLGHTDDSEVSRSVREMMKRPLLDFTGRCGLLETGAAISNSSLLLCNDSGVMHMASALSTPAVAIFGPTTKELGFYPYRTQYHVESSNINCRPCHHIGHDRCPKGHHRCMTEVGVEAVVEAASRLLVHEKTSVYMEERQNEFS
jgi:heptosyltransferase-2